VPVAGKSALPLRQSNATIEQQRAGLRRVNWTSPEQLNSVRERSEPGSRGNEVQDLPADPLFREHRLRAMLTRLGYLLSAPAIAKLGFVHGLIDDAR
jgi:hypothetical protein